MVRAIPVLEPDAINLGGSSSDVHLHHDRGLLHHLGEEGGTCMKVSVVGCLGLAKLQSSLHGWFVNPRKEVAHTAFTINTCISIGLEVLHLLENHFVM